MTAAHLTPAQARALGIIDNGLKEQVRRAGAPRPRATRRALPRDGARSTCHACGEQFTTDAAETRHVADTGHARYDTDTETT